MTDGERLPIDLPPQVPTAPDPMLGLSADRRRTLRQRQLIAQGRHPATKVPLRAEGGSCGSCVHAARRSGGNRWYWKCDLVAHTFGPGTDIRKSWPACERWEAR